MKKLSATGKKLIITIAAICAVLAVVILIFRFEPVFDYIRGLMLGSAFAMIKVYLMEQVLDKSLDMEPKQADNYVKLRYVFRYFLTGAVLALAAILPFVNFLGAVVGVFTLQPAAYIVSFLMRKDEAYKAVKNSETDIEKG